MIPILPFSFALQMTALDYMAEMPEPVKRSTKWLAAGLSGY
jgi:hypothetical protein